MLREWLKDFRSWWRRPSVFIETLRAELPAPVQAVAVSTPPRRLTRVILSDGVARTLFEDYAEHRRTPRGDEEIGWVLLGWRHPGEAIALAALPAGTQRDAGVAHVRFDSDAQALASRIVRQKDKRLQILGVVHTHPGNMRHPSHADLEGDRAWVGQLRDGVGIFGIGTADARSADANGDTHVLGDLCFSWYALGVGENSYRPLPAQVEPGPDLARPLRAVWNVIESHAVAVNKLCRQFAKVQLDVIDEGPAKLLAVKIALAESGQQIRLLLNDREARYYWDMADELIAIDPCEPHLERAVYLILAELAKEPDAKRSRMLVES